jgi:hypothetical protein
MDGWIESSLYHLIMKGDITVDKFKCLFRLRGDDEPFKVAETTNPFIHASLNEALKTIQPKRWPMHQETTSNLPDRKVFIQL